MDKLKLNYFVDALMTISFFVTAFTGLIIFFFLPSGVQKGGYQVFIEITKQTWTAVHNWSGIIMIVLVLVHFILHWNWIVSATKKLFSKREGGKK
jgi:cytochrome b subunit of formate dehydrogenase